MYKNVMKLKNVVRYDLFFFFFFFALFLLNLSNKILLFINICKVHWDLAYVNEWSNLMCHNSALMGFTNLLHW